MKLHRNLDSYFTVLFLLTGLLSPFAFGPGIKGQDWMRTCAPYFRPFVALSWIALGPWIMSSALKVRHSEEAKTIWTKTWPFTFAFGVLSLLAGFAALWVIHFVK